MKDKTFYTLVWLLVGLGVALTLAHLLYISYAYQHGSIIYFIANEIW